MNPIKPPSPMKVRMDFLQRVASLFKPDHDAAAFWQGYLDALALLCEGSAALLVRSQGARQAWEQVAAYPVPAPADSLELLHAKVKDAAAALTQKPDEEAGVLLGDLDHAMVAARLVVGNENQQWMALVFLGESNLATAQEKLQALIQLRDLPAQCQAQRSQAGAQTRLQQMAGILDLAALLHEQENFLSAAMVFCNELAARHRCERVSLGWLRKGYVRLAAMSHSDSPEGKMEAARKLELAMEESLDQNAEIPWPPPRDAGEISRDHDAYGRSQEAGHLLSLPLRTKDKAQAVAILERKASAFSETEQQLLRIACDHAMPRLSELRLRDRWLGAVVADRLKAWAGKLAGFDHTGAKVLAMGAAAALAFACFVPVPYRIEAPAILRSDRMTFLTAPFDGHIEQVLFRAGDEVAAGQELLRLDKSELLLREAGLEAEIRRYQTEAEKARAANELADMRISQSLQEQAVSRLDLVRHRLGQSQLRSPYAGVVVEGDLQERIGSPVRQGEELVKIARIQSLHAEIEVAEADIDRVVAAMSGGMALAAKPQERFPFRVAMVEPAAQVAKGGNVFVARGAFEGVPPSWWRPGMTGIAKLSAGRQTLFWIGTHKTLDFLRLHLWW